MLPQAQRATLALHQPSGPQRCRTHFRAPPSLLTDGLRVRGSAASEHCRAAQVRQRTDPDGGRAHARKPNNERKRIMKSQAAQRVSGVNALTVDLKVKVSGLGDRTDVDIARSVENLLEW